jgi:threonine/homoserine/homoserine lactone efflux protein
MKIPWPIPESTVVLGIAAVATVIALLKFLPALAFITRLDGIALFLNLAGCGVMAFGAWKEYQAKLPKSAPPASSPPPAPPPAA